MVSPMDAPDRPTEIEIEFERGGPDGDRRRGDEPGALLTRLNELGGGTASAPSTSSRTGSSA